MNNEEWGLIVGIERPYVIVSSLNEEQLKVSIEKENDIPLYWESLEIFMEEGIFVKFDPKEKRILSND